MTEFVLNPFGASRRRGEEDVLTAPTYSAQTVSYELTVAQVDSPSNATMSVGIHTSPSLDDKAFTSLFSFDAVSGTTTLPVSLSTDVAMPAHARFHRLNVDIEGAGEWFFEVTSHVTFFDTTHGDHLDLLSKKYQTPSDLSDVAEMAERDVIERYRRFTTEPLHLIADKDVGDAVRAAIARRIEWIYGERNIVHRDGSAPEVAQHRRQEWRLEDRELRSLDNRIPLYSI